MFELNDPSSILYKVLIVVALLVALVGLVKKFRAKTAMENFKAEVLIGAPILSVFLIAFLFGAIDIPNLDSEEASKIQDPIESISGMQPLQIVLIICAFSLGYIGYAVLMHSHWRRIGKKPRIFENPFKPQYAEFNLKEWAILGGVMICFFGFGFAAIIA